MDYDALDFWLKFTNLAVTIGVGIYVWLTNRHRVTNSSITKLREDTTNGINGLRADTKKDIERLRDDFDDRLDKNATNIARLDEASRHIPTHDDLKRIHARIDEVSGGINRLEGQFVGASSTLNLIHEYLLKGQK